MIRHLCLSLVVLLALGCKAKVPEAAEAPAKAEAPKAATKPTTPPGHPPVAKPEPIPAPPDVAAPPADAEKTASGLASKVLQKGTGTAHPSEWDKVEVHYTGWQTDGKMFDSSVTRGKPATFGVSRVIPGWTEGLQLMVVGEKRRLWIPGKLAYGEKPEGDQPSMGRPMGMLVFDVELLSFEEGPKPPPVPEDVSAVPKNAKKTKSGLASRVLEKGTGKKKPTEASVVKVNYSGWTTDGKMFDSSITRGRPATFPLGRVIPGWTEGVQLMVEGEKRRFWIPGKLAYGEEGDADKARRGVPLGTLVFDVELIEIVQ